MHFDIIKRASSFEEQRSADRMNCRQTLRGEAVRGIRVRDDSGDQIGASTHHLDVLNPYDNPNPHANPNPRANPNTRAKSNPYPYHSPHASPNRHANPNDNAKLKPHDQHSPRFHCASN